MIELLVQSPQQDHFVLLYCMHDSIACCKHCDASITLNVYTHARLSVNSIQSAQF